MLIIDSFFLTTLEFHIALLTGKTCKAVKISNQRSSKKQSESPTEGKGIVLINTSTAFGNLTALSQLISH